MGRRRNPYYAGPVSDHFDGSRFHMPGAPTTTRSLGDMLRWRWQARGARQAPWPDTVAGHVSKPAQAVDGLRATPVGHATVLLQMPGCTLLTDPVWSDRVGPLPGVGPRRVCAPGIAFDELPRIDAVLLSHNHYDHFDVATLRRLQRAHRPVFVTPLGNDTLLRRHVPDAEISCGDWGTRFEVAGAMVELVPAWHWSARGLRDRRAALWCGFVVRNDRYAVYHVGDTGYGDGRLFDAIGRDFPDLDLALIPIGAYEPRWFMQSAHVDPEEAVRIFTAVGARHGLGIHWGTFRLSDEAYEAPASALGHALHHAGIATERFTAARAGVAVEIR